MGTVFPALLVLCVSAPFSIVEGQPFGRIGSVAGVDAP